MPLRSILTLRSTIRPRDTTPQAWQFLLASASRWARSGVGVGAGAAAGAATIPSTSTATTISIAIQTLAEVTAITSVTADVTTLAVGTVPRIPQPAVAVGVTLAAAIGRTLTAAIGHQPFPLAAEVPETGGSTTRSIAAELRIGTGRPPTGSGERRAVIRSPTVRPAPGNRSDGRAAIFRVPAGEAPQRAIARVQA